MYIKSNARHIVIILHVLFWGFYLVLNILLSQNLFDFNFYLSRISIFAVLNGVAYYLCYSLLVPFFLNKHEYLKLFLACFGIFLLTFIIRVTIESYYAPNLLNTIPGNIFKKHYIAITFVTQAAIILIASLMGVLNNNFFKEQQLINLKIDEARKELELIKAKINPHFILNTLNNIYSINYLESPKTSKVILQLSQVLRYTIYKSKSELITLAEEIELLESIVGLYQLKFDNKLKIKLNIEVSDAERVKIPSLILFSLLENAFKHSGLSIDSDSFIEMNIVHENSILSVDIKNSVTEKKYLAEEGFSSGLGKDAIIKLLNENFKSNYKFETRETNPFYNVVLELYGC